VSVSRVFGDVRRGMGLCLYRMVLLMCGIVTPCTYRYKVFLYRGCGGVRGSFERWIICANGNQKYYRL
jgi:hypothetical protein